MTEPILEKSNDIVWQHASEEITELSQDFANEIKKGDKANYNILKDTVYKIIIWQRHLQGQDLKIDTLDLIDDLENNTEELRATYCGRDHYLFLGIGIGLETVGALCSFFPAAQPTSSALTSLGSGIEKIQGTYDQGDAAKRVWGEFIKDKLTTRRQDWTQQCNQDNQAVDSTKRSAQEEEASRSRAFMS